MVKDNKFKVTSIFCGCGGADLGITGGFSYLRKQYRKHPMNIVHASDIDIKAVNTYNNNFKHKAICVDVRDVDFNNSSSDLVIGGFPCQNFSTVNPLKDPENKDHQLFWELVRAVSEIKPIAFIGENVKGFARLKKGKYLHMAIDAFEEIGYNVKYEILNSSHYGVPQLRERVFLVGIRKDLAINDDFQFPLPTHGEGLKKIVPIKRVKIDDDVVGEKYYFSKRAVEGVKKAKNNMKRALAQDINGPCLTITSHLAKVSLNSRDPVLLVDPANEKYRRFTPREAARIQSFPEGFEFVGSQGDAYRQIGNAVPPLVMWHIIEQLVPILEKAKYNHIPDIFPLHPKKQVNSNASLCESDLLTIC